MAGSVWKVNAQEYFEAPAASVLMYHDFYPEGRQSGIEIIQHDERVAANGDLRLGVWAHPKIGPRKAQPRKRTVTVAASFPEEGIDYTVRVVAEGDSLRVHLDLARPLPPEARGGSFVLDLFAPSYWGKTYHLGGRSGVFPRQNNGLVEATPGGGTKVVPLGRGETLVVAPEDPRRALVVARVGGELELHEGSWFQIKAPIAEQVTTNAVELVITPNQIRGWRRTPMIGVSQVGYHPDQVKRAVIELDPRVKEVGEGTLVRVGAEGGVREVLSAPLTPWGSFLRYQYALFDFTAVTAPGTYQIRYRGQETLPFRIDRDVYQRGMWEPTLETYLPVQMCHMHVWDDGLVWHGACHLDDAGQAPAPLVHIDGYEQGPTTETPFATDEHVPGLDRGGWHDAGDDDLAACAQAQTTFWLAMSREAFGLSTDRTSVRREERMVWLHRPDGVPDVIQQVTHGVECLLGGYRAVGHSFSGIIHRSQDQRVSGDWASVSDGLIYDPSLGADEVKDGRSGRKDDRWVFTSRDTAQEYQVAQALAASSRVLRGFEDALAQECLDTAVRAWEYEQFHAPVALPSAYVPRDRETQEIYATAELLLTTGGVRFRQRLLELQPTIVSAIVEARGVHTCAWAVARVLPLMEDEAFSAAVRAAVAVHRGAVEADLSKNPFRIPWHPHIWGVGWDVQKFACEQYFLVKAFPDLFDREIVLSIVNYVLGCHPGSNVSFACGVGAHTLTSEYGYLRAHWGYIPGAVVSGTALLRPDFPELKEGYPHIWQQSEDVIAGASTYIFCVLAAEELLNGGG